MINVTNERVLINVLCFCIGFIYIALYLLGNY